MSDHHDIPRHDIPRDDDMEPELHAFAQRVASPLRAPERVGDDFAARLADSIARETPAWAGSRPAAGDIPRQAKPVEATPLHGWRRALQPRTLSISPLAGLAAAAAFAGIVALGTAQVMTSRQREVAARNDTAKAAPVLAAATRDTVHVVQFVFVAPNASRVSVVGDFNDWKVDATPLRSVQAGGMWMVSVPLPAGRHEYSFVVDGTRWVADPTAPVAVESDYGAPSSVVTVGEVMS